MQFYINDMRTYTQIQSEQHNIHAVFTLSSTNGDS